MELIQSTKIITGWPEKKRIFGVPVSATNYKEAVECIASAAYENESACIDFMPVHGLMTAVEDSKFREAIENFEMVCPDGQPVRWALNKFHKANLTDRVYGPTLMLHMLERAEEDSLPAFFYGSTPDVLEMLREKLMSKFPNLIIAGMESPPFRTLTDNEYHEAAERISSSGARILFLGLGCPKQELWAARQKGYIDMPMLCVGAAFDFHAGTVKQAPSWMQKRGFEWLYRFCKEPKRLWKRYLVTNSVFVYMCIKQVLFNRRLMDRITN